MFSLFFPLPPSPPSSPHPTFSNIPSSVLQNTSHLSSLLSLDKRRGYRGAGDYIICYSNTDRKQFWKNLSNGKLCEADICKGKYLLYNVTSFSCSTNRVLVLNEAEYFREIIWERSSFCGLIKAVKVTLHVLFGFMPCLVFI